MNSPVLLLDLAVVRSRYVMLRSLLPDAEIAYAVKANPHAAVLSCLAELGASFDVASGPELEAVLEAGARAQNIEYSHPIKPVSYVTAAYSAGVQRFTVDGVDELKKIADHAPGSRILIRIGVDHTGAAWPLDDKFGVSVVEAVELLRLADKLGLVAAGVTFHVGSQQRNPDSYTKAFLLVQEIFLIARAEGLHLDEVNIGGGLPSYASADEGVPALNLYTRNIQKGMAGLPEGTRLTCEPGRYLVADAGTIEATVLGVVQRDGARWVYLDAGIYQGLTETSHVKAPCWSSKDSSGAVSVPTVLAGPTCDSLDVLYGGEPFLLSSALETGDKVMFGSVGAYSLTVSTVFNGFPSPEVVLA